MKDEGLDQGDDWQGDVVQDVDGDEPAGHGPKPKHQHEPQGEVTEQKEHSQTEALESLPDRARERGPAQTDAPEGDGECPCRREHYDEH